MLRLDPERMRLAIKMDCNLKQLEILQIAYAENINADKELVKKMDKLLKYTSIDDKRIFMTGKNLRKKVNYLMKISREKEQEAVCTRRDYEDYIEQLHRLRIPINNASRFPKDLYKAHEELSKLIAEIDKKIDAADLKEKNRILEKLVNEVKPLYDVKSKDFVIIWPKTKKDFVLEGQLQHNCVGGYFERCVKGRTTVFFLRRKENQDKPFCTVEFNNGTLIQCRTIYNKDAPEDARKYMEEVARHYQATVKGSIE